MIQNPYKFTIIFIKIVKKIMKKYKIWINIRKRYSRVYIKFEKRY